MNVVRLRRSTFTVGIVLGFAVFRATCFAAPEVLTLPDGEEGLGYAWILDGCGLNTEPTEACETTLLDSDAPPGLRLDSASRLEGTPTRKGTYKFTVRFRKYPQDVVDRAYTLKVKEAEGLPIASSVDRNSLYFGVSADGKVRTSPQTVAVTMHLPADSEQSGRAGWSAVASHPRVTLGGHPMDHDTRSREFRVDLARSLQPESIHDTITVTSSRALPGSFHKIEVVQSVVDASVPPTGSFDTPLEGAVVWGTVPVSGWALDNIEVASVQIWREPVPGEKAGEGELIYLGDAAFVPDARPDLEGEHPATPLNYRAAWGYVLLTSGLPSPEGASLNANRVYKLHAIARNKAGLAKDLGTRAIAVDNNRGSKPFGHIDTPEQDATVSGEVTSFAWALTQPPFSIPTDASTIWVAIDGQLTAHPVYNQYREDIVAAMPNFINSRGAVGYYQFDSTTLPNGAHTISWLVVDNGGRTQEIGTRAFQVRNTEARGGQKSGQTASGPPVGGVALRRGFDPNRSPETLVPDQKGDYSIQMEQLGRIELQLGAVDGYQIVYGQRRSLPVGSSIKDGTFYWQAALGFLGEFHLVLQRADSSEVRVKVKIVPKTYSPLVP